MRGRSYWTVFWFIILSSYVLAQSAMPSFLQKDLPDSFIEVVQKMEREGFELKDYLYTNQDNLSSYLVVVFEKSQPTAGKVSELHIYRSYLDGAELLTREVAEVDQGWAFSFHKLNNTDVNGDGLREIVIWKECGGTAWSCQQIRVYQVQGSRSVNLTEHITGSLFPASLVDVDHDGSLEIIAVETRWEAYEYLPHPQAPSVEEIFAWRSGSYRRATSEYPDFYQRRISEIESAIDQTENPYDYLGNSIRLLLNYVRMGQPEQGWEEFERLLQTDRAFSVPTRGKSSLIKGREVWQSIKDPIVEDFKKELSEPN